MLYFYRHAILPKRDRFVQNGALLCHNLCAAIEELITDRSDEAYNDRENVRG